jgi:AcrR family transcriptional regulator
MVNKKGDISTEKRILEAAHKVFVKKGYAAARMEDISKEAGINRALLHYYFRSKDKMFDIIFNEHFGEVLGGLTEMIKTEMPFEQRLKRIIEVYQNKFTSHPDLPLFVIHELAQNPDRLVQLIAKLPGGEGAKSKFATAFRAIVQKEIEEGRIRPIDGMQLLMNILALIIYPFIAKPIFQFVMNINEGDYKTMLSKRKEENYKFIMNAIKP